MQNLQAAAEDELSIEHELERGHGFDMTRKQKRRRLGAQVLEESERQRAQETLAWKRLKTDQITEASERLNGVVHNTFLYSLHDGDLQYQGQSLQPILERGVRTAEMLTRTKPQFAIELLRRNIELKQLKEQIALAEQNNECDPTILVHISPTPDAVLREEADLNAYDTTRKTVMVRVTEPTEEGVKVTSMSLDGNNKVALHAVGDFFNVDIPDNATSEDILAMSFYAKKHQFQGAQPTETLRGLYDHAMKLQYGGSWYAGRQDSDVLPTIQKILRYPSLIDAHVAEVEQLKKRFGDGFRAMPEYETAIYNFLAAIERSYKVGSVVTSLAVAGGVARESGQTFAKSNCPTGTSQTAEQALQSQGIAGRAGDTLRSWHYGVCRVCCQHGFVGECDVCAGCEAADNRGESLALIHARSLLAQKALESMRGSSQRHEYVSPVAVKNLGFEKMLKTMNVNLHRKIAVGSERFELEDRKTGAIVAASTSREKLFAGI